MGQRSAPRDIWTCCIFVLNVFFFLCPNLYRNSSKQTSVVLSHFLKTKTALCLHKCCGFCHYKICVWLRHLQKRNEKYSGGFVFSLWTTFPFFSLYVTISLGRWALDGSSVYKLGIIPSHFFPIPSHFPSVRSYVVEQFQPSSLWPSVDVCYLLPRHKCIAVKPEISQYMCACLWQTLENCGVRFWRSTLGIPAIFNLCSTYNSTACVSRQKPYWLDWFEVR